MTHVNTFDSLRTVTLSLNSIVRKDERLLDSSVINVIMSNEQQRVHRLMNKLCLCIQHLTKIIAEGRITSSVYRERAMLLDLQDLAPEFDFGQADTVLRVAPPDIGLAGANIYSQLHFSNILSGKSLDYLI